MKILNALRAIQKIKASLSSLKLGTDILENGDSIEFDGENILSGNQVFLKSASGDYSVLPDGSYKTKTSNIIFIIKDSLVETVNSKSAEAPKTESTEPVLQAQAKIEEVRTAMSELKNEILKVTEPSEEFKTALEVKAADATVTVDIQTVIDASLAPVYQMIYDIQTAIDNLAMLYVSQDSFNKVAEILELSNTKLSKVSETVNKIAKMPATEPIEGAVNAFSAKQNKSSKLTEGESRIMSILHADQD